MSDYIITYCKKKFYPLEPVIEDIMIEDIAHSLSMLCRANGHYDSFYSVGAHCINCYEEAVARRESARIKMACLLHDAAEAYISDVTRPVKKNISNYADIEEKLLNMIYEKFLGSPLNEYEEKVVKMIDDAMLYYEFYEFTAIKLEDDLPYVCATPDFYRGTMKQVEKEYLDIFNNIDLREETEVKETIKWIR
ncbi:MAG: phosphohydrolase [Lachnospiraceae bacterium]|nr:phosphohydrolase [Lachnospiraceae bacterium]